MTNERTIEAKKALHAAINEFKQKQEQERQLLLSDAKRNGVQIVHIFNKSNTMGGLTIAFRKTRPGQQSTNMVDVAIATCSFADNFSRRIGTGLALSKWFDGEIVQMPLSSGWRDEDLNGRVKDAFTAMWKTL